jgi:hypothetical protein
MRRRSEVRDTVVAWAIGLAVVCALTPAAIAHAQAKGEPARALTRREMAAWLAGPSVGPARDLSPSSERPPPPPRRPGLVVETGLGFWDPVSALRHVTPAAPRFYVHLGYAFFPWLAPFVESDLVLAETAYARPPPPSRTYAVYGAGAGARLAVQPWAHWGLHAKLAAGLAKASEEVLATYGYFNASRFRLYGSAELGVEWFPLSPHVSWVFDLGARSYAEGFRRPREGGLGLIAVGSLALRYAF